MAYIISRSRKLHFNVFCGLINLLLSKLKINFITLQKKKYQKLIYSAYFCIFSDFVILKTYFLIYHFLSIFYDY